MWASEKGWHGRGGHEDQISLACHETYWQAFADNCETFKAYARLPSRFFAPVSSQSRPQGEGWLVHAHL